MGDATSSAAAVLASAGAATAALMLTGGQTKRNNASSSSWMRSLAGWLAQGSEQLAAITEGDRKPGSPGKAPGTSAGHQQGMDALVPPSPEPVAHHHHASLNGSAYGVPSARSAGGGSSQAGDHPAAGQASTGALSRRNSASHDGRSRVSQDGGRSVSFSDQHAPPAPDARSVHSTHSYGPQSNGTARSNGHYGQEELASARSSASAGNGSVAGHSAAEPEAAMPALDGVDVAALAQLTAMVHAQGIDALNDADFESQLAAEIERLTQQSQSTRSPIRSPPRSPLHGTGAMQQQFGGDPYAAQRADPYEAQRAAEQAARDAELAALEAEVAALEHEQQLQQQLQQQQQQEEAAAAAAAEAAAQYAGADEYEHEHHNAAPELHTIPEEGSQLGSQLGSVDEGWAYGQAGAHHHGHHKAASSQGGGLEHIQEEMEHFQAAATASLPMNGARQHAGTPDMTMEIPNFDDSTHSIDELPARGGSLYTPSATTGVMAGASSSHGHGIINHYSRAPGSYAASESLVRAAPPSHANLLGVQRPQPTKSWKKRFVKMLVVGDCGLGKTTLIRALLSTPGEQLEVNDGTSTPMDDFQKDPDSLMTCVTWKNEADKEIWSYKIQDTPGYGDYTDIREHIAMMVEYVRLQNRAYLGMEQARERGDMGQADDPRIDLCLYCLPPHRLRANDIRYMHILGKEVPIVPIIMKADTMTIAEAHKYRQEIIHQLQTPGVPGLKGGVNVFKFSREALERSDLPPSVVSAVPPFMVVASKDVNKERLNDPEQPQYWPQRVYRWGVAEAYNVEHSDLYYLRKLLVAEALEDIINAKRARYETWRAEELAGIDWQRVQRRALTIGTGLVLPVVALIYAATKGFSGQRMRQSMAKQPAPKSFGSKAKQQHAAAKKPAQHQQVKATVEQPVPAAAPVEETSTAEPWESLVQYEAPAAPVEQPEAQHESSADGKPRRRRGLLG